MSALRPQEVRARLVEALGNGVQVAVVQVPHRLLNEDSVDERMVEILSYKQAVFDEFVRLSEISESTPEAVDTTESELARQVIDEERRRHFSSGSPIPT